MTTYSAVLRKPGFSAVFLSHSLTILATSISGLVVGAEINRETGSPFLTSVATLAPSLANILSAMGLMAHADTSRPRRLLVILQIALSLTIFAQVLSLTVPARLALLLLSGVISSLCAGIRLSLVRVLVGMDAYATSRSILNLSAGTVQIIGFAFAALFLSGVFAAGVFAALSVLLLISAVALRLLLPADVAVTKEANGLGFRRTWTVNFWVLRDPSMRRTLLLLWIPNGIVVGVESLFLSYDRDAAGLLFAAAAAGMLCGDFVTGRLLDRDQRRRINLPQRALIALPYLAFVLHPTAPIAAVLIFLSSLGFSSSLNLQEQLVDGIPDDRSGQVQGLESSGRVAAQGVFGLVAGGLAEITGAPLAMPLMAAASLASILVLSQSGLSRVRRTHLPSQEL